jgi:hypothetical protein
MALKIAEEDNFSRIRKILTDNSIDDSNIIKKGLRRAFEDLNLNEERNSSSAVPSSLKIDPPIP